MPPKSSWTQEQRDRRWQERKIKHARKKLTSSFVIPAQPSSLSVKSPTSPTQANSLQPVLPGGQPILESKAPTDVDMDMDEGTCNPEQSPKTQLPAKEISTDSPIADAPDPADQE
jgi:hypothetical protein